MSNDLTTRGGNYLASNDDYFAALAAEASGLKGGGDGKAFMKFDGNDGSASYGAEDTPIETGEDGTEFAMNPRSYARGWVIWVDSEVVHEEMVRLDEGPQPRKADLPDKGPYGEEDGPVEQYTMDFRLLDEPYVEMVFQANNVSKRRALAGLLKDFGNKFKMHPGKVPVVRLTSREFEGKTKGGRKVTKYAPEFKIVRWMDEADLIALSQGSKDDYDDEDRGARRSAPALEDRSSRRDDDRDDRRSSRRDEGDDRRSRRDEDDRDDRRSSRDDRPAREDRDDRRSSRDDDREDRRPAREEREEPVDDRPARRSSREDDREERRPAREDDDRPTRRSSREDDDRDDRRSSRDEEPADDAPRGRGRGRF